MLRIDPACYLQLWKPVSDKFDGMAEINNTTKEPFSLDSDFLYQLIEQAWEDKGRHDQTAVVSYPFEVDILVTFYER